MYRFDAEDPGQSLYTPTTVGVIHTQLQECAEYSEYLLPEGSILVNCFKWLLVHLKLLFFNPHTCITDGPINKFHNVHDYIHSSLPEWYNFKAHKQVMNMYTSI